MKLGLNLGFKLVKQDRCVHIIIRDEKLLIEICHPM